jgi:hypothetical protein
MHVEMRTLHRIAFGYSRMPSSKVILCSFSVAILAPWMTLSAACWAAFSLLSDVTNVAEGAGPLGASSFEDIVMPTHLSVVVGM